MGRTVFFTSRPFGHGDETIAVRCDFLQFQHRASDVTHGAGGDLMRSDHAQVVTLATVSPEDLSRLCPPGSSWDEPLWDTIAWDNEDGERVERRLKSADTDGSNLRCAFW